ncbi:MAG: ribosome recycling factor, partial [Methylococcales bacterium]|nr:ribosome recycling factor [Methylococcales bacterium]
LVKLVKHEVENGRISIRSIRRDANSEIKEALKEKMISEDESHKGEEKIQKLTDSYVKAMEKLLEEKEADLMSF